jgi:hypothetical protein
MDKAITTAFMIIVSVVVSVMVFNAVYPAVVAGSASLTSMQARMDERMKVQIEIVHVTAELDGWGVWQDSNGDGHFSTLLWVKNVGSLRIAAVTELDVFFGPEGDYVRIPYKDDAAGTFPYWDLTVENAAQWDPTGTARITIHDGAPRARGRYFVKVVLPNGLSDEDFFGL